LLQTAELNALDLLFRLRPNEAIDDRIVIVTLDEVDLQRLSWPVSDATLSQLLQTIRQAKPRAVGLDIYRDLRVDPGHEALLQTYRTMPNLVGIQQLQDSESLGVKPPIGLEPSHQVGFNNVVYDADRKIRRSLLYWIEDGNLYQSFAIQLAALYLSPEGITPQSVGSHPKTLKLGQATFPKIFPNAGVYMGANTGGYQVLVNYRGGTGHFRMVALRDVLDGKIAPAQFRDRIVLIGSTATSLKDFSATPYSANLSGGPKLMTGVEIQANFISQILSAALDGRSLLQPIPEPLEWVWVLVSTGLGVVLSWKLRSPYRTAVAIVGSNIVLLGIAYGGFWLGWVVPVVPNVLAMVSAGVVVISYIAHSEEELKRSKEFLHRIINSIPDPVFVKDQNHRWVVLNEAYSRFLGKPIDELVEKSDYDVFPQHEADVFWQQDDSVFQSRREQEHEAEFTSLEGITYQIATKRSLHQDAAGNLFLVGVIRDITRRKRVEDELRRKTVELSRSNAELRLSQDRLNYLANHDALTGLPNRKLLYERLSQSLERANTTLQTVAVMFLDLDGFKKINDTLGHGVGDLLLQAVAKRLTGCLRTSDLVARLGGDEFVVLLPAISAEEDVKIVAEKILATLAQPFAISGNTLSVTTSIGIGLYPTHTTEMEVLLESADAAMYEAKKAGKNQFAVAQAAQTGQPRSA
jgi:diguanylate cyclase (GGDEF)-like protein/PAS domain S-box-containing protein